MIKNLILITAIYLPPAIISLFVEVLSWRVIISLSVLWLVCAAVIIKAETTKNRDL